MIYKILIILIIIKLISSQHLNYYINNLHNQYKQSFNTINNDNYISLLEVIKGQDILAFGDSLTYGFVRYLSI
jgi:hypothetical protein